jgi:hypothetical protein
MPRVTAAALVAAIALASPGSTAAAQARGFDPLRLLEEHRIKRGQYGGSYVVAPATEARLNWYFANLGLRAFVRDIAPNVRAYLDLYIANLQPDRTVRDVILVSDQPVLFQDSDSDDSYAATFISLAVTYARVSGDRAWFIANLPVIRDVAARNLIHNRSPRGLTYNYQDPTKGRVAYLQDNTEVYRALADLAAYLASIGNNAEARTYATEAATTLRGIQTLFDASTSTWRWAADSDVPLSTTACYPDAVSQVFPEAFGVPVPAAWRAAGYAHLNRYQSAWPTSMCPDYPWVLLGYVAAIRGDTQRARAKLSHIERLAAEPANRGLITINELGWYRLTQEALRAVSTEGRAKALADGHYQIRSATAPLCMDLRSQDNRRVQITHCKAAELRQSFYLGRRDAHGFYLIHAVGGGQGRDAKYVVDRSASRGREVWALGLNSRDDALFRWAVKRNADGTYTVVNRQTSLCMDARDQDLRPGGVIQTYVCNGSRNQRWFMTRLD